MSLLNKIFSNAVNSLKKDNVVKHENRVKKSFSPLTIVLGVLLLIYSLALVSLFVYGMISSCKDFMEFTDDPIGLPTVFHFENYIMVLEKLTITPGTDPFTTYYFEHMFGFSLLYSIGCALATMLSTFMMAYACARFPKYIPSKVIFALVLFAITVPIIGNEPSSVQVTKDLGIYDTFFGMYFLKFTFQSIYFLLIYEAIKAIPKDYCEAAELDGASQFRIMTQVYLPLVLPIIGSVALLQFISYWNDYTTPLLYLPSYPTLSLGLMQFAHSTSGEIAGEPYKLAAAFMVSIPIFILFIIFNKPLMKNVGGGGVKG